MKRHQHFTVSADVYDVIYEEMLDYEGLAERLADLVLARNPDAWTLLEAGCGTGLYLEQLRGRFDLTGFDNSAQMLEIARDRLPDVPIHDLDMRTFDLGAQFDAVICMFSSIGYMTTFEDLIEAYRRFTAHLAPGGVVVVEPWLRPDSFIDGHRGVSLHERRGITAVRISDGRLDGTVSLMDMHHLVSKPGEPIQYFVEHHRLGLFTIEEHLAAFAEAGLTAEHLADWPLGRGLYVAHHPGQ